MKYSILFPPIRYKGEDLTDSIELTDEVAKPLLAIGVIGSYDPTQPVDRPPAEDDDIIEADEDDTALLDLINLNSASEADLIALPHIGKATAQKLVKGKPYQTLMEAQFASGLTTEQWAEIEGRLSV